MPLTPAVTRQRPADLCEFNTIQELVLGDAPKLERNPVLLKKKKRNCIAHFSLKICMVYFMILKYLQQIKMIKMIVCRNTYIKV